MQDKRTNYVFRVVAAAMVVYSFVALLLLLENGYFNTIFKKVGVYPEPESYTALFFVDAELLAKESEYVGNLKTFTFGVYNHENENQTYSFLVDVTSKDISTPVTNGTLYAKPGETVYYHVELDVADYPKSSIVNVTLPSHQKSIDFEIN